MTSGRNRRPLTLASIFACFACGSDGPIITPGATVASVSVVPAVAVLNIGGSQQFTATAHDADGNVMNGVSVSWSNDKPTVLAVTGSGRATGLTAGTASIMATVDGRSASAAITVVQSQPAVGDINVNAGTTFQTMMGWDAVPNIGQWECGTPNGPLYFPTALFQRYQAAALDSVANVGINRVRMPVRPSAEYSRDVWAEFESGQIDFDGYKQVWYDAVNDNGNPNVINPAGFHFGELQFNIDRVVQPYKQRLEARGEKLYIVLNFVQFGRVVPFQHRFEPPEYAEFMLAAFQFLKNRYGWVPDAIEIINEPDNGNNKWTAQQIGEVLAATGTRLAAAGYFPDFIAPSALSMSVAITLYNGMITVPGVRQYLDEFSYHRYGGVSTQALQTIGGIAEQGVRTAMLEHIGSGYENLHADLKTGRNSSWEQYTMGGCAAKDNGGGVLYIDVTNQSNPIVHVSGWMSFLRQYYRHVRLHAVRVGATSTKAALDPLAFVNKDGRFVVVAKATQAESFTVGGLPPGRYGIFYTTGPSEGAPDQKNIELPEVNLAAGQALSASIPGKGVITVYAK